MNKEIIELIKKEYQKRIDDKKRLENMMIRKQELEQDLKVQEYLKLNQLIKESGCEQKIQEKDDKIIESIFYKYQNQIKETNNIYIYLGTFKLSDEYDIVHGPSDERVNYDDSKAQYRIYINLENGMEKEIKIDKCEQFERENKIIFPNTSISNRRFYYELQKEFINDIIIDGQDRAVERILKKVKK